jgi:glycoside/pentoside/hexuronide:cation symporter, GPH family
LSGVADRASPRAGVYPLGFFALAFLDTLFTQWAVYFHTESGAATATTARWVGAALLVGYALQGTLNPLIGAASDRLRHPLGRRRPFVILGAPAVAFAFAGVWLAGGALGLWLIPLYCAAFTLVAQPYTTLLPTIAPTEQVRVRLAVAGSVLGFVAAGIALVSGPLLIEAGSFSALALAGFAVAWLGLLLPALLLREPILAPSPPTVGPFLASARAIMAKRPVALFLAGNVCLLAAVGALTMVSPFVPELLLGRERAYTGVLNGWLFGGMVATLPLMMRLSRRANPASIMAAASFAGAAVLAVVSALVWRGAAAMWIWWVGYGLLGATVLMALAGPPLVLSRFAERDGLRREGLIFGLNGMIAVGGGKALAAIMVGAMLGRELVASSATAVVLCMALSAVWFAAAAALLTASARADA